ncbi:uncharacterized protein N7459_004908 [Penicillium hispanicum]|uniref:uncharacterized protein n=1 Tax=Penicillium hispanicum TaxID=1080232 RepID=UPI0025402300|nr:uncharacterized protein N7459_004908 [Penicillium hispanicum]KAJ5585108.1 hypothetical protein N7459_004908 [Penicillium hispanicum]
MAEKRAHDEPEVPMHRQSKAARFNAHTLKRLHAAVKDNPEIDLATQMPLGYSNRLIDMRSVVQHSLERTKKTPQKEFIPEEDIRESLSAIDPVEVRFPLSHAVLELLKEVSKTADPLPNGLGQRICQALQRSEVIWKGAFARRRMVFKCATDIVVKAVRNIDDYTEYTTLQYLERHKPSIPAPKPLGVVSISGVSLIFMSYVRSVSLGEVWPTLDCGQKASLSNQLNTILLDLRSLPHTQGTAFGGGVEGEGCKDIRRHLRRSETPITGLDDFEDFIYSSPHPGGQVFVELLHRVSPPSYEHSTPHIVFTHGDLRPDNIVVEMTENNQYSITGILDWEYSGFYPDYYESVRCTNCLSPYEDDDWFLYLPECVSPQCYAHWWLDRVRETRVV